jgi:hypothetical protein
MENRFIGLSKRDLKDVQLRLFSELSNYRTDAKRARQRLETARSCMQEVKFQMKQLQEAMRRESIIQFPAPMIDVEQVVVLKEERSQSVK